MQERCCCGESRSTFLAELLFALSKDLSKSMRKSNSIHALDISYDIAAMCLMYESKTKDFLELQISSARTGTKEEAEGIEPELVLHAREPYNYDLLIGVLNTKTSIHYSGCGCSSDSVSSES